MCSCKSHATLCSFPFILCRWCMCACCICARMHVCARAQWLLMAIDELGSALHIQVHMTHIMWEKVEFGTACLPPQREGISCNCVQYLCLQKRNHIDSMLGRQVCTQAFLGRLLECAQECCYNVVGGASE